MRRILSVAQLIVSNEAPLSMMSDANPPTSEQRCLYCVRRADAARDLRRGGSRGKQLGARERSILLHAGRPAWRFAAPRSGGFALLIEDGTASEQTAMRAAAARMMRAGLVTVSQPRPEEARNWIRGRYEDGSRPSPDPLYRRLRLSRFCWRTLLGDEIIKSYPLALGVAGSRTRIRWDGRLDEALARANAACCCRASGGELELIRASLGPGGHF